MFLPALLAHPIHFSIDVLLLTHDGYSSQREWLAKQINPVTSESSIPGQRGSPTTSRREVLPRQDTRLLNNLLIMCGFLPARPGTHATTIVYIVLDGEPAAGTQKPTSIICTASLSGTAAQALYISYKVRRVEWLERKPTRTLLKANSSNVK